MCLYISTNMKKEKANFVKKMKENPDKVMLWKRYTVYTETGRVSSPFMYNTIKPRKNGIVLSNRKLVSLSRSEKYWREVNEGIHVYTDLEKAKRLKLPHERVFEIKADPADLIAVSADGTEAVFMKVQLVGRTAKQYFPQLKKKVVKKALSRP